MSGISSAVTIGGTRRTRSPPATIEISSEHTCLPPPTRWQFALIHEASSGGADGSARTMIDRCGTVALALLSAMLASVCFSRLDACATTFQSAARVNASSEISLLLRHSSARCFSIDVTST